MNPSVEPFNEAKYKALMDGLECSEIPLSQVRKWNAIFRFDSEFFEKKAVEIDNYLHKLPHIFLKDNEVVSGPFGSSLKSESYLTNGYMPFVRIENIRGGFYINTSNIYYIAKNDNDRIKNSELHLDDIVLSKVGNSIGYFARVDEQLNSCNISENNIGIKLQSYDVLFKHYVLTFLNSKQAQILVQRRTSGNAQPKLNVSDLCYIPIPTFSNDFYGLISGIILNSQKSIIAASSIYQSAEQTLLSALGMSDFTPSQQDVSVKLFSESCGFSGRWDAEYYLPKYDQLFGILRNLPTKPLGGENGIVTIKKSIEPGSDVYCENGIPFVRVSDVTKFGISEPSIKLPSDVAPNVSSLYPHKNTILFSKDGSVGIAYKVEKDLEIITSGALLHLTVKNSKEILPDYLTLVLNSNVVQLQAERDSSGAIIQHWKPSEIEKVVIPILDIKVQMSISKKVQESFALRHKSEKLLKYAKQSVEIAIEQDEETAIKWLKKEGVEC